MGSESNVPLLAETFRVPPGVALATRCLKTDFVTITRLIKAGVCRHLFQDQSACLPSPSMCLHDDIAAQIHNLIGPAPVLVSTRCKGTRWRRTPLRPFGLWAARPSEDPGSSPVQTNCYCHDALSNNNNNNNRVSSRYFCVHRGDQLVGKLLCG